MFFTHIFQALNEREEKSAKPQDSDHKVTEQSISDVTKTSQKPPKQTNLPVIETLKTSCVRSSSDPRGLPVCEIPPRATNGKPSPAPRRVTPDGRRTNRKNIAKTIPCECIAPLAILATPALPPIGKNEVFQHLSQTSDTFLHSRNCNGWPFSTRLPPLEMTAIADSASREKQQQTKSKTKTKAKKITKRKAVYTLSQSTTENRTQLESYQVKHFENQDGKLDEINTTVSGPNKNEKPEGETPILKPISYRSLFNHSKTFPTTVQLQEFEEIFFQTDEQTMGLEDEKVLTSVQQNNNEYINSCGPNTDQIPLPKSSDLNNEDDYRV